MLTANLLRGVQNQDDVPGDRLSGIVRAPLIVERDLEVLETHVDRGQCLPRDPPRRYTSSRL